MTLSLQMQIELKTSFLVLGQRYWFKIIVALVTVG